MQIYGPKSSLNANSGANALLKNQVLAISAWSKIGLVKTLLMESSYVFKTDLLIIKLQFLCLMSYKHRKPEMKKSLNSKPPTSPFAGST